MLLNVVIVLELTLIYINRTHTIKMNKTRCEIALDISLRAVQHDLDGDSALACKLYKDASRALEDAIAHARNGETSSMEENDIEQMQRKVKEYRERAETLSSRSKGGGGGEDDDTKTNIVAGAAAAGAMIGFATMGPFGAIGWASSMAYASTRKKGIASSVSKISGSAVIKTMERAKSLNRKYKIDEKVKENGKIALEKAKQLDEKYKVRENMKTQGERLGKMLEEKFLSNKESVSKLPETPGKRR